MLATTKNGKPTTRNKALHNQRKGGASGDRDRISFSETPKGSVSALTASRQNCAAICLEMLKRVETKCA